MNKYEKEKLRQAHNRARRRALVLAGFNTGTDAEIFQTLKSGLCKIWEQVKEQGYTLDEFAKCLEDIEKMN